MSEVKRYNCTNGNAQYCYGCYQMDEDSDGNWVQASDFDAAKSELTALREELADTSNSLELSKAELTWQEQDNADLRKTLTAAEQRNTKQSQLLRQALNMIRGMHYEEFELEVCEILNNKSTESGASE